MTRITAAPTSNKSLLRRTIAGKTIVFSCPDQFLNVGPVFLQRHAFFQTTEKKSFQNTRSSAYSKTTSLLDINIHKHTFH